MQASWSLIAGTYMKVDGENGLLRVVFYTHVHAVPLPLLHTNKSVTLLIDWSDSVGKCLSNIHEFLHLIPSTT